MKFCMNRGQKSRKAEGRVNMSVKVLLEALNGKVNENIYGQFIELALNCIDGGIYDSQNVFADEDGIRKDVLEKIKEIAPPVLRFPGGTVMCQYHWEDAVGPLERRICRKNLIWGGELNPEFGTAEFIKFCRKIGAEPMLCVNMASGTPEEAGNWVEYCNGTGNSYYAQLRCQHGYEEPFCVKYWCIGNESYAEPDIGVHHDVNLYIRDAWEYIKYMKLTDNSIKTIIVGCEREEWNKAVLDALHTVTDYFSIHHYSGEGENGIYAPFEGEQNLKYLLEKVTNLIDTYPEKVTDFNPWYRFHSRTEKIKIALDEWNIWDYVADETYGLLPTYCWRDAVWVASILNLIINNPSIDMANMAQMVNVLAPIVTEDNGCWFQTIGYPLRLYRKTMIGERITINYTSPQIIAHKEKSLDALSISGIRSNNGTVYIAIVNRDFEHEYIIELEKNEFFNQKESEMTVLTADSPRAVCSLSECCVHEISEHIDTNNIRLRKGSINLIAIDA